MSFDPVVISLPITDRRTSYDFYRQGLALASIGEPDADGIPEPLQFTLNGGLRIMLIPHIGFEQTVGGAAAPPSYHECFLVVSAANPAATDALIQRAVTAGARLAMPPGPKPWGYVGAFADPDGHLWMIRANT